MSAYTSSKSYSSRFKYGAEFLERNIGSPVVNTVGTVSRKTGVEGGIRWALQRRDANESVDGNKRRKKDGPSAEEDENMEMQNDMETSHMEALPPYDDHKSPNYEEVQQQRPCYERNKTWQSRLMISTSGLGVAMSEESLRRLTYCLKWLKWANDRLNSAVMVLKNMLEKWEEEKQKNSTDETSSQQKALLLRNMQAVKEDVLRTLQQVVNIVSKYTGGALPENAGTLVRSHLMSLPQRFRLASSSTTTTTTSSSSSTGSPDSTGSGSEEASSAHRALVLAQEGLEMMSQVHRVVDETLASAQMWCERFGRKLPDRDPDESQKGPPPETTQNDTHYQTQNDQSTILSDVKQPIVDTSDRDVEMMEPKIVQ